MQDCKEMKKLINFQKEVLRKPDLCQRKQEVSLSRMSRFPATMPVLQDGSQDG